MTFSATRRRTGLGLLGHIDHAATAFADLLQQLVAAQGLPHRVIRQLGRRTRPDPKRSVIPRERQARIWLSMGGQERLEAQSQGRVPVASAIQESRPFQFGQSQGRDKEVCFTLWRGWQGRWRAIHFTYGSTRCGTTQLDGEPGLSEGPPFLGGGHSDAQNGGRFLKGQPDEVTQLHQFNFAGLGGGQFV